MIYIAFRAQIEACNTWIFIFSIYTLLWTDITNFKILLLDAD